MTKAPTISAITANTRRNVVKKLSCCAMASWFSSVSCVAGDHLDALVGRAAAREVLRPARSWLTPVGGHDAIWSNLPGSATSAWAVGRSNRATVAPAGLSAVAEA